MHTLFSYDGHNVNKTPIDHMNFHHTKWLDIYNPTAHEIDQISKITKISKHDLQIYLDREELPRVSEAEHFSVVIYKSPIQLNRHGNITTTSVTFLVSEKLLITMHKEQIDVLEDNIKLDKESLGSLMSKGTSDLFYHFLERITNHYFVNLDDVEAQINRIEDTVFSNPGQKTVKKIFRLKRTLIYFHKGLAANRDVLASLQKEFGKEIKTKVQRKLHHIYLDCVQLLDVVATYRDILTGSLDIYLSAMSNNMNLVMKKMAAYGTLVLVPTFITGLYGMNFRMLPELEWKYGYLFAWGLIVFSFIALVFYFKRKDWF